ncbi:hypothetical protein F9B44_18300, partial [Staphylococcus epidermidis]
YQFIDYCFLCMSFSSGVPLISYQFIDYCFLGRNSGTLSWLLRISPANLTRSGNSPLDDQSTTVSMSFSSNILHVHSTIYMDCLTCNIFCTIRC